MVVQGKVAKIACILLGIIFLVMALNAVIKNLVAEKDEAQIVHIVERFTTSRDIRAGNDGGRDSSVEYGIVAEIAIDGTSDTQKISITRRTEDNIRIYGYAGSALIKSSFYTATAKMSIFSAFHAIQ